MRLNRMAASATLHCLTGCAIGEIAGLMIGTALGWSAMRTMALAIGLAFVFGYALSSLPLVRGGLSIRRALALVLAADTLSILTMEIVDNAVVAAVPGAMEAGLTEPLFWLAMTLALGVAFLAAYPVNAYLLARGKGHALTHAFHGGHGDHAAHEDHAAHGEHAGHDDGEHTHSHDHSQHDHSQHDHSQHDHSQHDHSQHAHAAGATEGH